MFLSFGRSQMTWTPSWRTSGRAPKGYAASRCSIMTSQGSGSATGTTPTAIHAGEQRYTAN